MNASERIEHIVVLMLENRSFDHMLGLLPGVEGLLGKDGQIRKDLSNLADSSDPSSTRYAVGDGAPYAIPTKDIGDAGFGGPSHSFPAATEQLYGTKTPSTEQIGAEAPLSGFVQSYIKELKYSVHREDPSEAETSVPMLAFDPSRVPVLSTLAREYCVCDHWYSEVPGPTQPNRLFTHAATSLGFTHNVWSHPIHARTIYEQLDDEGRSWAFYYHDLSDSNSFPQLNKRTDRIHTFDRFFQDARSGRTLPYYSFLCPLYADTPVERANSQHAPYDIRYGEYLIAEVYEALRQSEVWESTLLVIIYDEHGGFYDHVGPPHEGVASPDGLSSPTDYDKQEAAKSERSKYLLDPDYAFDFTRLGLRVPAVLVSPWIAKGRVDSTPYQHTSIMATLRKWSGIAEPLTKRDAQAADFGALLEQLDAPRTDTLTRLPRPSLPTETDEDYLQQPLTDKQKDIFPLIGHLDGHHDSGQAVEPPATRGEAQAYIKERIDAHERYHAERRRQATFEVYTDKGGGHRWRLRDPQGSIIAVSGEAHATEAEARAEVASLRDLAPYARLRRTPP